MALRLALHVAFQRISGADSANTNSVWKELWQAQVPAKVKIFNWKALHTLPCRAILANRHIMVSAQCPICEHGVEDIRHILFTCDCATQVWKALGLDMIIKEKLLVDRAGQVTLEHLICLGKKKSPVLGHSNLQTRFMIGTWYIWWERRQHINGDKLQLPHRTAMAITILAPNYSAAAKTRKQNGIKRHGWRKPAGGLVKLNVDAAFDDMTKTGATGAILRDSNGLFIGANN
ncbi:hypothetical protein ACQ4PT_000998 [Festuca glaucescens]